ncbi:MAG: Holliday junction branch migration protein RuvA [Cytophagaceae bacterium]
MIAYIDGKLTFKDATYVIIETGGIGYQIKISLNTYSSMREGERCKLHTYLHIKEDAHTLFGFHELNEKRVFLNLISISGVGPTTAMMVLSSLGPAEIEQAIINEDVRTIQSVKGIGGKTAQRIILELKDKIKKDSLASDGRSISANPYNTLRNEALSALVTLGIARNIAEKSIDSILKKEGNTISLEQLIKLALKTA